MTFLLFSSGLFFINSANASCDPAGDIVINEFMANPAGSDSDREWIELRNNAETAVDISGWALKGGASSLSNIGTFPEGATISSGGYLLIGDSDVVADLGQMPDHVFSMSLGNAGSNADAIQLSDCDGIVADTVVYGDSNSDGWLDDTGGIAGSFAPAPIEGQSLGRMPDGQDSDLSASDFEVLDFATPWLANDGNGVCHGQNVIKINEFLPNPDGSDATFEWIELHNSSSESVQLQGWSIQYGKSGYTDELSLPSVSIQANGYLLIGGTGVPDADVVASSENDIDMGSGSSNSDALRLIHCGPGVADTVVFGPSDEAGVAKNTDSWLDDDGSIATSSAPKPIEGMTLARRLDGEDSDDSSIDFVVSIMNTPGESNPEVRCEEGDLNIKINEIYPNPSGTDGGNEWIELYNTGLSSVRLDDWVIQTASSSWSDKFVFPPETTIEAGEFFILGEVNVPSEIADITSTSNISLGNASSGFDGVRLIDCPGMVQDTLLYGKPGAIAEEGEVDFRDDQGAVSAAIISDSGLSLGRYPDGSDSDDNSVDFQTNMDPTPGLANTPGEIPDDGNGPGTVPSTGCNKAPEAGEEPSKCSSIQSTPHALWMVMLIALYRRKH